MSAVDDLDTDQLQRLVRRYRDQRGLAVLPDLRRAARHDPRPRLRANAVSVSDDLLVTDLATRFDRTLPEFDEWLRYAALESTEAPAG